MCRNMRKCMAKPCMANIWHVFKQKYKKIKQRRSKTLWPPSHPRIALWGPPLRVYSLSVCDHRSPLGFSAPCLLGQSVSSKHGANSRRSQHLRVAPSQAWLSTHTSASYPTCHLALNSPGDLWPLRAMKHPPGGPSSQAPPCSAY
jgi:hypothetical protein